VGCGDAQSCSFVDERAQERHTLDSVADAQATSFPEDEKKQTCGAEGTTFTKPSKVHRGSAAILAGAVLRLQCLFGEKVKEKLEYMHANPVVRGLVKHPKDWPWSSWSNYAKGEAGLVEIDLVGV
jgi:hypothetical protein